MIPTLLPDAAIFFSINAARGTAAEGSITIFIRSQARRIAEIIAF
jgi:hypothetical protein